MSDVRFYIYEDMPLASYSNHIPYIYFCVPGFSDEAFPATMLFADIREESQNGFYRYYATLAVGIDLNGITGFKVEAHWAFGTAPAPEPTKVLHSAAEFTAWTQGR